MNDLTKEAYQRGFIKAAMENGYSEVEARLIYKLAFNFGIEDGANAAAEAWKENTAPPPPAPAPVQPVPSANQAPPPPSVQNIGQGGPPAPIAQNVDINNEITARDLNNSHLKEFIRRHGIAFDPSSAMDRNKMEYIAGAKVRPSYPLTPQGVI